MHFELQSSGLSSSPVRAHSGAFAPDPVEPPAPRFTGTAGAAPPSAPAPNSGTVGAAPPALDKGQGDCAAAVSLCAGHLAATLPDFAPACGEGLGAGVPRRAPSLLPGRAISCIRTEDGTVILFDRMTGRAVSGLTRAAAEAALLRLIGAAPAA